MRCMVKTIDNLLPLRQIRRWQVEAELINRNLIQFLGMQQQRYAVNRIRINGRDNRPQRHIGKQGDFFTFFQGHGAVGAAQQDIRLNADRAQLFHRVLCRLGLDLSGGGDVGHQRQMHEQRPLTPQFDAHLTNRLHERQRLDIANSSTNLNHGDIGAL